MKGRKTMGSTANTGKTLNKKRIWSFVAYPESLPGDWIEKIQKTGLPFSVSPLHDSDKDPTEENKKSHYHVILSYDGPVTYNQVKKLTDELNQPIPQPLNSVKGMYRYFTHKDNPDKFQYDEKDIKSYNGFCISNYEQFTKTEIMQYIIKIQQMIRDYNITEYSELMDILIDNQMTDEFYIASTHTLFFDRYVSSRRHHKAFQQLTKGE
jgi:hypothetical protein